MTTIRNFRIGVEVDADDPTKGARVVVQAMVKGFGDTTVESSRWTISADTARGLAARLIVAAESAGPITIPEIST